MGFWCHLFRFFLCLLNKHFIDLRSFNSTVTNGIMINFKQNQVFKKFPVTQLFRPGKGCNIPLSSILQFETKTKSYYPSRNKPEVSLP